MNEIYFSLMTRPFIKIFIALHNVFLTRCDQSQHQLNGHCFSKKII